MSVRVIDRVFRQTGIASSDKFVLVALADNATEDGRAWPATSTIARKTGQDRKTVVAALDRLESAGWIKDTGGRTGRTKQVKIYRLPLASEQHEGFQKRDGPSTEGSQIRDTKDAQNPAEGSQIRDTKGSQKRETEPSEEPLQNHKSEPNGRARDEVVSYTEAYRILGRISEVHFKEPLRENQWPQKWVWLLSEAMPLKRVDLELVEWFYRLPDNHEIFTVTRKRQSIAAIIENLVSEPQKIRSALRAIEHNGAKPLRPIARDEALAPEYGAMIRKIYGPDAFVPARMKDLTPSVRVEIEELLAKEEAAVRERPKT